MTKLVKIVTPEIKDNALPISDDMRVFADKAEIHGIVSMDVHFRPNEITQATIEIYAETGVIDAEAIFVITNPYTGQRQIVKHIEFEDDSVFDG